MFNKTRDNVNPIARIDGLSITESGDETLVYDRENFVIHRLGPETATVWRLADGSRDLATIAGETSAKLEKSVSVRDVETAIAELASMALATTEPVRKAGITRRLFVGGAAGTAASGTFMHASANSGTWVGRCYNNGWNEFGCKSLCQAAGYRGRTTCSTEAGDPSPGDVNDPQGDCYCF